MEMSIEKNDLIIAGLLSKSCFYFYKLIETQDRVKLNTANLAGCLKVKGLSERSIYSAKKDLKRLNILTYKKGYKNQRSALFKINQKEKWNMDRLVRLWRNKYLGRIEMDEFKAAIKKHNVGHFENMVFLSSLFSEKEFELVSEIYIKTVTDKTKIPTFRDESILFDNAKDLYFSISMWQRVCGKLAKYGVMLLKMHGGGGSYIKPLPRSIWNMNAILEDFKNKHLDLYEALEDFDWNDIEIKKKEKRTIKKKTEFKGELFKRLEKM